MPIPHTAIIQSNQHRIADKLGEFIELHFPEAAPVEAKLRQINFGSFVADQKLGPDWRSTAAKSCFGCCD